jgi:phosphinothricin acetyltransferase
MMCVTIRDASQADLPAINEIYNHYVLHSTATFQERVVSADERRAWWREHAGRLPVLVAEAGAEVIGWAALTPYCGRCAYRFTAEDTVYLRPEACGRGLGRRLLEELLRRGADVGLHSVVAIVSAESAPSLRLHAALGFETVGRLREVGFKCGRWIDVVFMQRAC